MIAYTSVLQWSYYGSTSLSVYAIWLSRINQPNLNLSIPIYVSLIVKEEVLLIKIKHESVPGTNQY